MRNYKYKRGTPLEITELFGNGEESKTVGYYWMDDTVNKRIVLISTYPPLKLGGNIIEKRYCNYILITNIRRLGKQI